MLGPEAPGQELWSAADAAGTGHAGEAKRSSNGGGSAQHAAHWGPGRASPQVLALCRVQLDSRWRRAPASGTRRGLRAAGLPALSSRELVLAGAPGAMVGARAGCGCRAGGPPGTGFLRRCTHIPATSPGRGAGLLPLASGSFSQSPRSTTEIRETNSGRCIFSGLL